MPITYAILGATGFTGRCLVSQLLSVPDTTLHLYCRSQSKLFSQNPTFAKSGISDNVKLFIGDLETELVTDCVRGADAVFCVLATNESKPGCRIAQDQAIAVLTALKTIRASSESPSIVSSISLTSLPRLIILSAAPVSSVFSAHLPLPISLLLWRALGSLYRDLQAAELLLQAEKEWVRATFVYPGGLSNVGDERCYGHKVVTTVDEEKEAGGKFMSYGDLAAGMIEIARDGEGRWDWVDTSVMPTGDAVRMEWWAWGRMMAGGMVFGG